MNSIVNVIAKWHKSSKNGIQIRNLYSKITFTRCRHSLKTAKIVTDSQRHRGRGAGGPGAMAPLRKFCRKFRKFSTLVGKIEIWLIDSQISCGSSIASDIQALGVNTVKVLWRCGVML